MSVILVHEPNGYSLKNNSVILQGVTEVERTEVDGAPVVKAKAVLKRKEYVTEKNSEMVLVVGADGEVSLKHGDQFIEGATDVSEKDGVIEFTLEVASEDYAPIRAAKKEKKAEPKVVEAPKKPLKPEVKAEEKLEA